jgi:hypothetical protein
MPTDVGKQTLVPYNAGYYLFHANESPSPCTPFR